MLSILAGALAIISRVVLRITLPVVWASFWAGARWMVRTLAVIVKGSQDGVIRIADELTTRVVTTLGMNQYDKAIYYTSLVTATATVLAGWILLAHLTVALFWWIF